MEEYRRQEFENKRHERREIARETYESKRASEVFKEPKGTGLGTLLAHEPAIPAFHIEEWWPHGGTVVVQAPRKWGKSTLVRNTVTSVMTGDPFLGQFAVTSGFKRALLIDMELTERQFYDYWVGSPMSDAQVSVWQLRGSAGTMAIRSDWVRREITKKIADTGAELVVLDPLGPALRACVFAENSNDDLGRFLDLWDEIRKDAGVTASFIPHHVGHSGDHGRGASVLGDKADATWTGTFAKTGAGIGDERFLGAIGRMPERESTELAFDPATRVMTMNEYCRPRALVAKESKAEKEARELAERVRLVETALIVNTGGFSSNPALLAYLKVSWNGTRLAAVRQALMDSGKIRRSGVGWYPNVPKS